MLCKVVGSAKFRDPGSEDFDPFKSSHASHYFFLGRKVFHQDVVTQSPFRQRLAVGGDHHPSGHGLDFGFAVPVDDANGRISRSAARRIVSRSKARVATGTSSTPAGCFELAIFVEGVMKAV